MHSIIFKEQLKEGGGGGGGEMMTMFWNIALIMPIYTHAYAK